MILALACALAQEGSLDVLDGETLYEGGWLFTLGYEFERREGLRHGTDRVSDPLDRRLEEHTLAAGAHYGLRHDLQVSAIVPYLSRVLTLDSDRLSEDGLGDVALVGKWRYYRWDDVGKALNLAVLAGLNLPTGDVDVQEGARSWDASLGTAATYEPGRWRFNAAALYQRNGEGARDFKEGDELFGELAIGNRFWLEPYPGPFMRADLLLRYRHEWRSRDAGDVVHDSGGDLVTLGATWAFRPRPTLDVQIFVEYPIYQSVQGFQLEEDVSVFVAVGWRM